MPSLYGWMTSSRRRPSSPGGLRRFGGAADGLVVLLARIVAQLSQFAIFIVAARLLSPEEFGLFAVVSGVAVLLARLGEAGWREFVIASRDAAAVEQAMTASILGGSLSTALCFGVALCVDLAGGDGETVLLLCLFALWLLPTGVTAIQAGMLVRRERLGALSLAQTACELAGFAVSILALVGGAGVLSLVYGRLAYQLISVAILFGLTRWFPPLRLERSVARELIEFSRQILASRLIGFFRSYSATLSVGSLLGPASAGYFRAAERLVLSLSEILAETFQAVAWKTFKRSQSGAADGEATRRRLGEDAVFFHPILLATAAPIFVGLALVSGNLIEAVLGAKWRPAAAVASVIAIRQLLLMPSFLTEPLLAMAGEIRRVPPVSAMTALVSVALIVAGAPFGILAVAVGQVLAATLSLTMAIRLQSRYAGVSFRTVAARSAAILPALAVMAAAVLLVDEAGRQAALAPGLILALQVAAGGLAYGAALLALQGVTVQERRLLARPVPA